MEDFTRELTPGNTKAAMKAVGAASSDLWKVAPDQLRTLDGFNARIKNDAYAARVRWIARLYARGQLEGTVMPRKD